jgi:hypothetical protein
MLFAAAACVAFAACAENDQSSQENAYQSLAAYVPPYLPPGTRARINGSAPNWPEYKDFGQQLMGLPSDSSALEDLRRALLMPQEQGLHEMGRLATESRMVGVPNGVEVTVLEQGPAGTHVRIEEKDRVYTGKIAWAPSEWVSRVVVAPATASLPKYTVLDRTGGSVGILVPTLRAEMGDQVLSPILVAIAEREGARSASFYRTRAAFEGNYDSTIPNHESIMRNGYVGTVEDGAYRRSVYHLR